MKIVLICILTFIFGKVFSQTDTSYKTLKIFSISYQDYGSKTKVLNDISLINLDSNFITFEEIIYGQNSLQNKYVRHTLIYDKIKEFGYKVNPSPSSNVGTGAIIGFATGFVAGCLIGTMASDGPEPTISDRMQFGALLGLLTALPGALIGSFTVTDINEHAKTDISKLTPKEKYETIKIIITKGIKVNVKR